MHKLKAFFAGLIDPKASEAYMFWGTAVMSAACHLNAGVCAALTSIHADTLIPGLIAYVIGRMTSKAVKATAPAA